MAPERGAFEVVVANILAQPLVELAPLLAGAVAPGGRLLLSGILAEQAGRVAEAYEPFIEFAPAAMQDGWVVLEGTRRP